MESEIRLRKAYSKSPLARAIADYFATLDEAATKADVSAIVAALPAQHQHRQNVVAFLKDLEQWKLGDFKAGRRGYDSRLESPISLRKIGQTARQADRKEASDVADVSEDSEDIHCKSGNDALPPNSNGIPHRQNLTHQFLLRPNYLLTVKLPVDLTRAEANRLAEFVKSLPFD